MCEVYAAFFHKKKKKKKIYFTVHRFKFPYIDQSAPNIIYLDLFNGYCMYIMQMQYENVEKPVVGKGGREISPVLAKTRPTPSIH